MKGIILAGGKGTRLRPLTFTTPKPLVVVNKKPLINYNLSLFSEHGVGEIKIIIRPEDREHYRRWHVENASRFPGATIAFVEEEEPMGTFGYVAHHLAEWMGDEKIFVTNGDDIKNIDLERMIDAHNLAGTAASIALMKMNDPSDYGSVMVEGGNVVGFLEKQNSASPGWVSAGMYIIDWRIISFAKERVVPWQTFLMFEKDIFPLLAKTKNLHAFFCEGTFFDCGTPERLANAEQFLREDTQPDRH